MIIFSKRPLKSLQLIQNGATRVLTRARRAYFSPASFFIGSNSRCKSRIKSEILLLNKILNIQTPSYLKELIVPYHHNRALHSQTAGSIVVPRIFQSRMLGRAFSFKALLLWKRSSQFGFGRQTLSKISLNFIFLVKHILRAESSLS